MYCSSLSRVSFPSVSSVGLNAFTMCSALEGISLPALTSLNSMAFQSCYNMSYAYLGGSSADLLTSQSAFRYCSNLTDVSIPRAPTLASYMFANCSNLSTLVLPGTTNISGSVFQSCYHLLSLYVLASTMCTLAAVNAFINTPISNYTTSTGGVYGSIFVPSALLDTYKNATNWKTYSARMVGLTDAEIAALL